MPDITRHGLAGEGRQPLAGPMTVTAGQILSVSTFGTRDATIDILWSRVLFNIHINLRNYNSTKNGTHIGFDGYNATANIITKPYLRIYQT